MTRRILLIFGLVSVALLAMINFVYAQESGPQAIDVPQAVMGIAFTYQGQLKDNGSPANGTFDFLFRLYATESGGSPLGNLAESTDVTVTNGYFVTQIDFGANAFNGEARWLGIWVRLGASTGTYTTLTPRQPLTPAPYALALPGLRMQPNATSPNVIGGYSGNFISSTVVGGVIGGGGSSQDMNRVQSDYATIGGGRSNTASGPESTVGGGNSNYAGSNLSTIAGGGFNVASGWDATVGGGSDNTAGTYWATVPGGRYNTASGMYSFAAGHHTQANHDGTFVWSDDSAADYFTSTAENQFLIRANGGVGINTTNTLASGLTVNGQVIAGGTGVPTGSAEPFVARGSNAGISLDDRSDADSRWVIYANSGSLRFWNGAERASLSGAGVLTLGALGSAGSTTLCRNASNQIATCSSSIRYKDNVSVLDLGLETVAQLRPVTFDWTGTGEYDLGFVAEEVAAVTPLLTTQNTAGQIEGVKYDRITAVLVNAVQEQQQQIKDLQQQNADLQARLANLDPTTPASFNVFNVLSVLAMVAVVGLFWQQRRMKRGES